LAFLKFVKIREFENFGSLISGVQYVAVTPMSDCCSTKRPRSTKKLFIFATHSRCFAKQFDPVNQPQLEPTQSAKGHRMHSGRSQYSEKAQNVSPKRKFCFSFTIKAVSEKPSLRNDMFPQKAWPILRMMTVAQTVKLKLLKKPAARYI
jgi:hypothetical protein